MKLTGKIQKTHFCFWLSLSTDCSLVVGTYPILLHEQAKEWDGRDGTVHVRLTLVNGQTQEK